MAKLNITTERHGEGSETPDQEKQSQILNEVLTRLAKVVCELDEGIDFLGSFSMVISGNTGAVGAVSVRGKAGMIEDFSRTLNKLGYTVIRTDAHEAANESRGPLNG